MQKTDQKEQLKQALYFVIPALILGYTLQSFWGYLGAFLGGGLGAIIGLGVYRLFNKK